MNLPIVFRSTAQTEFDEAAVWYENQRTGLGADFAADINNTIAALSEQPDKYPIAALDIREAPVAHFPYCVNCRVKAERIVIVAVFHSSRNPLIWQSRN